MGIGNPLRGDDGVGPFIARRFRCLGWISLDSGTAPENFTGVVRREHPDLVVVVDAADMGVAPGEFRCIPLPRLVDVSFSTHGPSLVSFIQFITPLANRILIIGMQPCRIKDEIGLSPQLEEAAENLITILENGKVDQVLVLER